ncbi:type I-G CRISPR-associated RAMP protein Csb1/Cas7g [Phytoactinopolyspora limicola]|uniref:type I-G CRISPR-associated RAMP protein Csb1/Cas7g n=1 Tax=Phytoactinopolyspora limicola TaxID=2715536 RepID=UPI00140E4025|nr:type I-U CRISPR-associated RAMP protein Csb1/Cas7u [Phytoactinopolyspora limicola]
MTATRHVYDAELKPILGSTFQPTGFPDLGAATFTRLEDGEPVESLLVESVQSMANRLEATAWNPGSQQPEDVVQGLSYVRVDRQSTGEFLTSSRLEAHRLASPFVWESEGDDGTTFFDVITARLGLAKDTPLNYPKMARAILELDPFCLVHGVFFSRKEWLGQPKFPRAVSGVIEAHNVKQAPSGGRKADHVRHQLDRDAEGGGTAEGYGSVPFHRMEWTAERIVASFVVDVDLLRSYGLPDGTTDMLITLAQWEIRSLLSGGLRLRTACDLEVVGDAETRRGDPLPNLDELTERLTTLIAESRDVLGDGEPTVVRWAKG